MDGAGGSLQLLVGLGDTSGGGDIVLSAGPTTAQAQQGGSLFLHAGDGLNTHVNDGGDGGDVNVIGGTADGLNVNDNGGDINLSGGRSYAGYGGNLLMTSGPSVLSSSGSILVETANAGTTSVSGDLFFRTGTTSVGDSGLTTLMTGTAFSGKGGHLFYTIFFNYIQ